MDIKKIIDYEIDAHEADLIVSDGKHDLLCYAQPFENPECSFRLIAFRADNIVIADNKCYFIRKTDETYYSYKLCGQVIDNNKQIVRVFDLVIEIGVGIPNDILKNDYIEFSVERIDYVEIK